MTSCAYCINVVGIVQGVGFRHYTSKEANRLSLEGYVRNLENGSVEIHVQGQQDAVNEFIEWCHSGPRSARVDRLEYEPVKEELCDGFTIQR